jgi:16S rRNA (cytosine967-C5)-methyltransferase
LMVGLYQLMETRIATHAAVDQTVRAVAACGVPRARGMVNAVLRRFDREREAIASGLAADDRYRTAHPDWLVARVREAWPDEADAVFEVGNQRPPMWLRAADDRAAAVSALDAAGLTSQVPESPACAIRLTTPSEVHVLPGFDRGALSVQDASAQFAAPLLAAEDGMRVLDACAAPGGKTLHLLQQTAGLELVALDVDPARLERVRENLTRAGADATLTAADVRDVEAWWDGRPFDRVLLDAPCSGIGVIRRHPDIKSLRRESDLVGFTTLQRELLDACWRTLAPGGRLLYVTCSILPQEGDDVIAGFIADHDDAASRPIDLPIGRRTEYGHQILSGEADQDGFHYACLERAGSP